MAASYAFVFPVSIPFTIILYIPNNRVVSSIRERVCPRVRVRPYKERARVRVANLVPTFHPRARISLILPSLVPSLVFGQSL